MKPYEDALQECSASIERLETLLALRKKHGEEAGQLAEYLRKLLGSAQAQLAALQTLGEAGYLEAQERAQREKEARLARNRGRHQAAWAGQLTPDEMLREIE